MKRFLSIQSIIVKGNNSRGGMSRSAIIISAVMEIKWETVFRGGMILKVMKYLIVKGGYRSYMGC